MNLNSTLVLTYTDPIEHFKGWLVVDEMNYSLCAGGMRVQKGLTEEHLKMMARNMTKKYRLSGLPINGAKSGIDYDPASPGKREAVYRFIGALMPFLKTYYSMGSDLNTTMDELDEIAKRYGISTVKFAISTVQGFEPAQFSDRCRILDRPAIGSWKLGKIRSGYAVAISTMKVLNYLHIPQNTATVAVQGFGVLAKSAIVSLLDQGVKIHAVSDIEKCLIATNDKPLPVERWLEHEGTKLPEVVPNADYDVCDKDKLCEVPCDVLVLAAIENAVTEKNVHLVNAQAIVPGANLAVSELAEKILHEKGVIVLPSFVAGAGGVISMNGLFGPESHPTPEQVLVHIKSKVAEIIDETLKKSLKESITPTQAANDLAALINIPYRAQPYCV